MTEETLLKAVKFRLLKMRGEIDALINIINETAPELEVS